MFFLLSSFVLCIRLILYQVLVLGLVPLVAVAEHVAEGGVALEEVGVAEISVHFRANHLGYSTS